MWLKQRLRKTIVFNKCVKKTIVFFSNSGLKISQCQIYIVYYNNSHQKIKVKDFGQSWRDGKQFLGVLHSIDPALVDEKKVSSGSNIENLELAFNLAEQHFGIPQFLEGITLKKNSLKTFFKNIF